MCRIHIMPSVKLTLANRQNSVEELYSLIKFLRIKPLNDWPTFKEQVAQPIKNGRAARALKRLQVTFQLFRVYSATVNLYV